MQSQETLCSHLSHASALLCRGDLASSDAVAVRRGMLALLTAIEYATHGCNETRTAVIVPEHQWPEHARWLGDLMEMLHTEQRQGSAA